MAIPRDGLGCGGGWSRSVRRPVAWAALLAALLGCGRLDITVPGDGGGPPQGEVDWLVAAAGGLHSCGLTASGAVYCWGAAGRGQLGRGGAVTGGGGCEEPCSPRPAAALGPRAGFDTVVAGGRHTCGLTPGGDAYCWGANERGQLGDSTRIDRSVPTRVAGDHSFAELSAGGVHTCGVTREGGHLFCWGDDFWGQDGRLGRSTVPAVTPRFVLRDVRDVATGADHSCALVGPDRLLYCWGRNHRGQLGLGYVSRAPETAPTLVFATVRSVSAGAVHTCARSARSSAPICWGWNDEGAVGTGDDSGFEADPRLVADAGAYRELSAGGGHTCGVRSDGVLRCWGDDFRGQLGTGASGGFRSSPAGVSSDRRFRTVTTGLGAAVERPAAPPDDRDGRRFAAHTCAVDGSGELLCWGANGHGQLGDGTLVDRSAPVPVAGPGGG